MRAERTSAVFAGETNSLVFHEFGGGNLKIVDVDAASDKTAAKASHAILNLSVSDSGRLLAASGESQLTIYETSEFETILTEKTIDLPFLQAALTDFSDDEKRLIAAGSGGIFVLNIEENTQVPIQINDDLAETVDIAWAPDDTFILCKKESVRRYDLAGNLVGSLIESHLNEAMCISTDGRRAAIITHGFVRVYDLKTNKLERELRPLGAADIAFSPNGQQLAIADLEENVTLVDVESGDQLWSVRAPGRYRLPWTVPAVGLLVWAIVVDSLRRRRKKFAARSDAAPESETVA